MNKGRKFLIVLGVLALIVGGLFFFLHDDADVEKIAKEQKASSETAADNMANDLEASFEE